MNKTQEEVSPPINITKTILKTIIIIFNYFVIKLHTRPILHILKYSQEKIQYTKTNFSRWLNFRM